MGDLNQSLVRLQSFDLDDLEDVEACQERWYADVKSTLKVCDVEQLTANKFMGSSKQFMSGWLADARDIMDRQKNIMICMKEMIELLKTEAISDKEKVIRFQGELLQCKDDQLKSLRSTVETAVETTVKKEIKSYSAAVSKTPRDPVLTPDSLQKVVRKAIVEEDRTKNVIVFGLVEEDKEELEEKICELFSDLDEKPHITAARIGSPKTAVCRPVKVNLASSTTACQILSKARRLKQMERRKMVYICPDRSSEERAGRKRLVIEMKKITEEQPSCYYFIKDGKIHSRDRIKS